MKKLTLKKESIRLIQGQEAEAAGGLFPFPMPTRDPLSIFGCNSRTCTYCAHTVGACTNTLD